MIWVIGYVLGVVASSIFWSFTTLKYLHVIIASLFWLPCAVYCVVRSFEEAWKTLTR